jgi:DNA-directed RNA polymerase specialized sigma24 family protein
MPDWKQFENHTTEDLIKFIKRKDQPEYTEASKDAFAAFCFRFRADLIRKCEVICSKWNYDIDAAIELAHRTFRKFWLKPFYDHSMRKSAKTWDEGVKFYLYRIANNELINIYREHNDPNPYNGEETIIRDFPADLENFETERKKELEERKEIFEMAFGSLSPKHKIIYLTYLIHAKDGKNLPRHLLKSLRDELGLAQETIRYYNFEAKRTVNNYLKIWKLKKV